MKYFIFSLFFLISTINTAGADEQLRNLPPTEKPRITISDITWPKDIGQAEICLWKDDKLAAVTITIDDNSAPDHEWWLDAGKKYNFPFTWFVITARVNSGNAYFGTWEGFQKLLDAGHDVQSHTYDHFSKVKEEPVGTEENYTRSIKDLEEHLPKHRVKTLAYPGGPNQKNDPEIAKKYYIAARGGAGHLNDAAKVNYINTNSLSGTPQLDPNHWAGMTNLIEKNPKRTQIYRGWASVHYHGLTNTRDPNNNVKEKVSEFLEYLKKNEDKYWVAKFTDVAMYGQERDTAKLSVGGGAQITIDLTDQMDDQLFDTPLTVKVRVDPKWTKITATQTQADVKKELSFKRIEHDGGVFALVQIVPDRGQVVISGE